MLTVDQFLPHISSLTNATRFLIAFSGGLDSSVLLHLFVQCKTFNPKLELRAVYINHGLSPNADHWQQVCHRTCDEYGVTLVIKKLQLKKKPQQSLEELARIERYQAFRELLADNEILITGHHQDDQAETVILQLFRGSGPYGLAAMPVEAAFGKTALIRPLLNFRRAALLAYAKQNDMTWLEDESNSNTTFDRNFLRQELLPMMEERWPGLINNLTRTARHCGQAKQYIEHSVQNLYLTIFEPATKGLKLSLLLEQDLVVQSYLIRYWLGQLAMPIPNTKKLNMLLEQLTCRHDAMPLVRWSNVEVRRYDGSLFALTLLQPHDVDTVIPWNLESDLELPADLGSISLQLLSDHGLDLSMLQDVTIRFRRGGERCRLLNRNHSHSLKKLLQLWRVPPWQRDRIPLLYSAEELKAVIGYAICQ